MIIIKTDNEVEKMRRAGEKLARLLDDVLLKNVILGANAFHIETLVRKYIDEIGAKSATIGYRGYEYATCISVNEEVIHGFPLKTKIFNNGDIVSIDVSIIYDGYVADGARTYMIGEVNETTRKLVEVTKESFFVGVNNAVAGKRLGDISAAIQKHVETNGFNVIREFCGHGVGRKLHEDPEVLNYGKEGTGPLLRKNMTIAVEPMVVQGERDVEVIEDNWTVVTVDNKPAAHYENTIVITSNEPEILTMLR